MKHSCIDPFNDPEALRRAFENMEDEPDDNPDIEYLVSVWEQASNYLYTIGPDGLSSLERFTKHLPESEIVSAMEQAANKIPVDEQVQRFKYFCGICWNKIKNKPKKYVVKL